MQKISPFLWFDGQAEEAARFYVSIFKKRSKILSVSRYNEAGPGKKGRAMSVTFRLEGQEFLALNGGPMFKFTPAISFFVHCKDQKEVDYYWDRLLEGGGRPNQCGWLNDRYGLSWQIVPIQLGRLLGSKDEKKSARVMAAMLQMVKLDVKGLTDAAKTPAKKR